MRAFTKRNVTNFAIPSQKIHRFFYITDCNSKIICELSKNLCGCHETFQSC